MPHTPKSTCPVVSFISTRPGMAADMLRRHVDDGSGHCAGCRWYSSSRPTSTHPCLIRYYALAAHDVEQRRAAGQDRL